MAWGRNTYIVRIRNNETDEEVDYVCDADWDEVSDYMWTDGNYACDCNRHLFFNRGKGNDDFDEDHNCSDEKYSVLYVKLPTGEKIPIDDVSGGDK